MSDETDTIAHVTTTPIEPSKKRRHHPLLPEVQAQVDAIRAAGRLIRDHGEKPGAIQAAITVLSNHIAQQAAK